MKLKGHIFNGKLEVWYQHSGKGPTERFTNWQSLKEWSKYLASR